MLCNLWWILNKLVYQFSSLLYFIIRKFSRFITEQLIRKVKTSHDRPGFLAHGCGATHLPGLYPIVVTGIFHSQIFMFC